MLPVRAVKQATISTAADPAIVTLKNVGKVRPRHLICAVDMTIDGQRCTPDSHSPRISGRIAHREVPEGLVGIGGTVTAGDEDRHMLHPRQLLQATVEGADI